MDDNSIQRPCSMVLGVGMLVILLCAPAVAAQSDPDALRLGFTRGILKNNNENDFLAAMKVWAGAIANEGEVRLTPDIIVFDSPAEAEGAVRAKEVDALTILLAEIPEFPEGMLSGPYFRTQVQGETHQRYVLLSRMNLEVTDLEDLRGGDLYVHETLDAELSTLWLSAHLAESGIAGSAGDFFNIVPQPKLSTTVLGLFFGQADACLVSEEGYESMVELNPQLSIQIKVVAISPSIIPSTLCFRSDLEVSSKDWLFTRILRLTDSVTGQQVLRVFKAERMAVLAQEDLDRSLALLQQWRRLKARGPMPNRKSRGGSP